MNRTIYALLVGINEYEGGVSNLHGCVPDVKHMHEFLEARTQAGDFVLNARVLTSGDPDNRNEIKPTKQALIDGFRQHLCNAGEKDIALFYYSGHGSQEVAPELFWPGEPDHLNETLVCADSRLPGHYDLADKELGWLIQEVASQDAQGTPKAGSPHVVVILDSCHSGSGTREVDDTLTRLAPTDQRLRPLDTYIFKPEAAKGPQRVGIVTGSSRLRVITFCFRPVGQMRQPRSVRLGRTENHAGYSLIVYWRRCRAAAAT